MILNSITEIATRADLLDRCIIIYLPAISDDKRKDEKAFYKEFDKARPQILAGICDRLSTALANLDHVKLTSLPRMADFAKFIVASTDEKSAVAFLKAYSDNRKSANELSLDANYVSALLIAFMKDRSEAWTGTATELLVELDANASEELRKQRYYIKDAKTLSNTLRRLSANFRAIEINITFYREPDKNRRRLIQIENKGNLASEASEASAIDDNNSDDDRTQGGLSDAGLDAVISIPSKDFSTLSDGADGADGEMPLFSICKVHGCAKARHPVLGSYCPDCIEVEGCGHA